MIEINNKMNCCGCMACVQACPKQCISMCMDEEGFYYPKPDLASCIKCGLCEKKCPLLNLQESIIPRQIYAAKNKEKKILKRSSSGGAFFCFASKIIEQEGVVFGAKFDESWNVVHDYTESLDGLDAFISSKYVQSRIGSAFRVAEKFLDQGRLVLFSGTPCQIAGLRSFLKKDYENLYTVDFLCHGVPSPKIWSIYLSQLLKRFQRFKESCAQIERISFRDKPNGWLDFFLTIDISVREKNLLKKLSISSSHRKNPYMRGFLNNLFLRPSCHSCKFKRFQNHSDVTMGDFWGIGRVNLNFFDPMGVSMLFVNSLKGEKLLSLVRNQLEICETDFDSTLSNNGLNQEVKKHPRRDYFFAHVDEKINIQSLLYKCVGPSRFRRFLSTIKGVLK